MKTPHTNQLMLLLEEDAKPTKTFMRLSDDLGVDGYVDLHTMRLLLRRMLEAGVPPDGGVDATLHIRLPHGRPRVRVRLGELPEMSIPDYMCLIMLCDDRGLGELLKVTAYIEDLCITVLRPDAKTLPTEWTRSHLIGGEELWPTEQGTCRTRT